MKYSMHHRVSYSEVAANEHIGIFQMINYFQDCTTFQSEDLGCGFYDLSKKNRAWLLSSWQIEVDRFPAFNERITIRTWPYAWKGVYGYRNFEIIDEEGIQIARAGSIWVYTDTKNLTPVRVDMDDVNKYPTDEPLDLAYAPRKIRSPKQYEQREPFAVIKSFIDTNHHMNNAQYVSLAEEYLPEGFDIHSLRVYYKQSAMLHDLVYPRVTADEDTYTIQLCKEDGDPYAVVLFG